MSGYMSGASSSNSGVDWDKMRIRNEQYVSVCTEILEAGTEIILEMGQQITTHGIVFSKTVLVPPVLEPLPLNVPSVLEKVKKIYDTGVRGKLQITPLYNHTSADDGAPTLLGYNLLLLKPVEAKKKEEI